MPYIPKFNKLSLQEMAYAPQLMRQQHDEAVAKNMEIAESLKFDYLNQDAPTLEPKLQKYSQDVENVAKDLATSGFSHDTKNKILGLRSEFSGDAQIRNIKKNYAQAMSGWEETKKSLLQKGASGQQINKMKQSYFADYTGAYDDEGFYSEFTPGATSGIYDIAEDTKKLMTGLGKTGVIVGKDGTGIQMIPADPATGIPAHYRISTGTPGQYVTTQDQTEAVAAYQKMQYDPANTTSDRGLYSKIMGYDPNDINNIIDNVATSMTSSYYQSLPRQSESIQGLGAAGGTGVGSQIARTGTATFPGMGADTSKEYQRQKDAMAVEAGYKSYQDLQNAAGRKSTASDKAEITKAYQEYLKNNPEEASMLGGMIGRAKAIKEGQILNQIMPTLGSFKSKQAKDVLRSIDVQIEETPDQDVPLYSINNIAVASGKSVGEANNIEKGITDTFKDYFSSFKGTTKKEQKAFEDIKDIDKVIDFGYDTRYGLAFRVRGKNEDKETVESLVYLPETEFDKENIFINYLSQIDPRYLLQYEQRHNR